MLQWFIAGVISITSVAAAVFLIGLIIAGEDTKEKEECYTAVLTIAGPRGLESTMDTEFCGHLHDAYGPGHHFKGRYHAGAMPLRPPLEGEREQMGPVPRMQAPKR